MGANGHNRNNRSDGPFSKHRKPNGHKGPYQIPPFLGIDIGYPLPNSNDYEISEKSICAYIMIMKYVDLRTKNE